MSEIFIIIMFIVGCLFCLFLTCLIYECFRYMKRLNDEREHNNNNQTLRENEAHYKTIITSKQSHNESDVKKNNRE